MNIFNGKSILVTGGTGSFGKELVKTILKHAKPKKLVIFSRDELKTILNGAKIFLQKSLIS